MFFICFFSLELAFAVSEFVRMSYGVFLLYLVWGYAVATVVYWILVLYADSFNTR